MDASVVHPTSPPAQLHWSPELQVLARPYRAFARLAAEPADAPPLSLGLRRPLLLLVVIGAFVSFTASGRLTLSHLGWSVPFWAFVPLIHIGVLALTLALFSPRRPRPERLGFVHAIDLYFLARAPWLLLIVGLTAALTLFIGGRVSIFGFFLAGPVPILLIAVSAWSGLLDHAYFRAALGLSRPRALLATAFGYVAYPAPGVAWYLLTEQLQPLLESVVIH